jgi:hypothetical protein
LSERKRAMDGAVMSRRQSHLNTILSPNIQPSVRTSYQWTLGETAALTGCILALVGVALHVWIRRFGHLP